MSRDVDAAANQRDARRGRRLARDGQERLFDRDRLPVEIDDATHLEHDDPRTLGRRSLDERSRTTPGERRHLDDRSAPTARRVGRPTQRAWKRRQRFVGSRGGRGERARSRGEGQGSGDDELLEQRIRRELGSDRE